MAKKATKKPVEEAVKVVEMVKPKEEAPAALHIKCVRPFVDATTGQTRQVGEEWDVQRERLEQIQAVEADINTQLVQVL